MSDFKCVYAAIRNWTDKQGIELRERDLGADRPGEFDGLHITINPHFSLEERTYYLAHALGSIVIWSQNKERVAKAFDELRSAKETKEDQNRLERAIEKYRDFETQSSELAVCLLESLGHSEVVGSYTNFMRADLESMTLYHRQGKAPSWAGFFAYWNRQVISGERQIIRFRPRSIKQFVPHKIKL